MDIYPLKQSASSLFASLCRSKPSGESEPKAAYICCPRCLSDNVRRVGSRAMVDGPVVIQFHCDNCDENFEWSTHEA